MMTLYIFITNHSQFIDFTASFLYFSLIFWHSDQINRFLKFVPLFSSWTISFPKVSQRAEAYPLSNTESYTNVS